MYQLWWFYQKVKSLYIILVLQAMATRCSLNLNITVMCCTNDGTCYNTSDVTMDGSGTITASFTNLPRSVSYNTSILLEYNSGIIFTSNEVITSTVNIILLTIVIIMR